MITGKTRIYGILADPIYHVKTPELMGEVFREHGIDAVLIPVHVKVENLQTVVNGLRGQESFGGFIATVPHKTLMPALCDHLSLQAQQIGAVNCVRRNKDGTMSGAMLDGIGFIEGLRSRGHDAFGKSVVMHGAGGAACAIAFALAEAGATHITVLNRTADKAEQLCTRIRHYYPKISLDISAEKFERHDVVVNATSLGMQTGDALPFTAEQLQPHQLVCEIIMEPEYTPLLKLASEKNCSIHFGKPMLASQIRLMAQHMGALD